MVLGAAIRDAGADKCLPLHSSIETPITTAPDGPGQPTIRHSTGLGHWSGTDEEHHEFLVALRPGLRTRRRRDQQHRHRRPRHQRHPRDRARPAHR
ncbi:hypothetical protein EFN17_04275, partial [Propionibacterium freudenreichii]|nr:hypothetical protein [Propionibacterium freudenreichii]